MSNNQSRQDGAARAGSQQQTAQEARARRGRRPADDPVSLGLRKLWQGVEHEPVPAEFLALLDAIDAKTGEQESDDGTAT